MREKIGKVELIYDFYTGNDFYSDGSIEERLLEIAKAGNIGKSLYTSTEWPILYHFSRIRENLIDWYPFRENAAILEIGSGCGAITGVLCEKAQKVVGIELSKRRSYINAYKNKDCANLEIFVGNFEAMHIEQKFDYVTLIGVLEYSGLYIHSESPYEDMLKRVKEYLKPDGKIIIAIENKMGLKYLNGAFEDHTSKAYSGINDYINVKNVRTFSKKQLENLLKRSGIDCFEFYYPLPDYKLPTEIYSDQKMPEAGSVRYYRTNYDNNRLYLFNEAIAFDQVCEDMEFDYFANSFLIICNEEGSTVDYVKYNRERREEYRIKTVINHDKEGRYVSKIALNEASVGHIKRLEKNGEQIEKLYVNSEVLQGALSNDSFSYTYLEGYNLDEIFFQWRHDAQRFVEEVRKAIKYYYQYDGQNTMPFHMTDNFRSVFGDKAPDDGLSLMITNIDYLFHNIRISNHKAYVFDYEWVFDFPVPHDYVIWRSVVQLYDKYRMYLSGQISRTVFLNMLGFSDETDKIYRSMEECFAEYTKGKNCREVYTSRYKKSSFMQTLKVL